MSIVSYTKAMIDTLLAGKAALSHTHAATDIASGTVASARLGSGSASSSTYLRGDGTWATPSGSTSDATTSSKGVVQLAGDLAGTAASPTVPGLSGKVGTGRQVIAGTGLTGGGDLTADRTLAVAYGTAAGTAAQGNDARITGALAKTSGGYVPAASLAPWSTITVQLDPTTGFWPASWDSDGKPVYTGGSATAGVRPTSRADIVCRWRAPSGSTWPAVVSSGTAGMRDGVDEVLVTG